MNSCFEPQVDLLFFYITGSSHLTYNSLHFMPIYVMPGQITEKGLQNENNTPYCKYVAGWML